LSIHKKINILKKKPTGKVEKGLTPPKPPPPESRIVDISLKMA